MDSLVACDQQNYTHIYFLGFEQQQKKTSQFNDQFGVVRVMFSREKNNGDIERAGLAHFRIFIE